MLLFVQQLHEIHIAIVYYIYYVVYDTALGLYFTTTTTTTTTTTNILQLRASNVMRTELQNIN